jgi:hypothetical protein
VNASSPCYPEQRKGIMETNERTAKDYKDRAYVLWNKSDRTFDAADEAAERGDASYADELWVTGVRLNLWGLAIAEEWGIVL